MACSNISISISIGISHKKTLRGNFSRVFKTSKHCSNFIKEGNKLVGFIGRNFEYKWVKVILTLFNSFVCRHLEYCIQFWSPYFRKYIDKVERIQRKVTKIILRLRSKPFEELLKELNLFSSSKHRLRGDLIEVFKLFCLDNVSINDYITTDLTSTTRNNGFKISV